MKGRQDVSEPLTDDQLRYYRRYLAEINVLGDGVVTADLPEALLAEIDRLMAENAALVQMSVRGSGGHWGTCYPGRHGWSMSTFETRTEAIEDVRNEMARLIAEAASNPERPRLSDAIKALRAAGGSEWDKIADVDEYLGRKDGEARPC
jgi:hypothetical protein